MNIKQHFIQGLMPRLDALQAAREGLKTDPDNAEKSIKRIAHILRGSGGTFGFHKVSALAGEVEDAPSKAIPQVLEKLIRLLTTLIAEQDVVHIQDSIILQSQDDLPIYYTLPSGLEEASYILKMIAKDAKGRQAVKTIGNVIIDTQWREEMNEAMKASSTIFSNGQGKRIEVNFMSPSFPLDICFKLYVSAKHRQLPILLVEDTPEDALLTKSVLNKANYEVIHAESVAEAKRIMLQKPISMVVLDLLLGDSDGRDFLIELRSHQITENIPAVILSSKKDTQTKTECLALGANGYFEKPLDPDLLLATISAQLNMSQKHLMESRMDTLTELPNRVAFKEVYSRTQAALERKSIQIFSVGLVDLDRFKKINDYYGHEMGDNILKHVSSIIKKGLRKTDVIARWGGEEFVILFPKTSPKGARQAMDKIRMALTIDPYLANDGNSIPVTISAGIVGVDEPKPLEAALPIADTLLYKAKDSGRDMILIPTDRIQEIAKEIAVVDDDEITGGFIKHRLESEGYTVTRYSNGQDAFEGLKESSPALIISDVKMPGMDGFELLKRLREIPKMADVPIIMLTSIGKEKDVARGLNNGANDYIVKPFSATELLARIDRLLRKHENINY